MRMGKGAPSQAGSSLSEAHMGEQEASGWERQSLAVEFLGGRKGR
jgi:hypothetical protein